MSTSFDVRIYKTDVYTGKTTTTWWVQWAVAGRRFKEPFKRAALANGFHAKLLAAAQEGQAFDTERGLPVSMVRKAATMSWFDFACEYVDMKWPNASPGHRRTIADALVPISFAMLRKPPTDGTQAKATRQTLRRAFSVHTRPDPAELRTLSKGSRATGDLARPDVLRALLASIEKKLDGSHAAPDTIRLRRITLTNALDFAVEKQLLPENPLTDVKVRRSKTNLHQVDRRSVVNPVQARTLLTAVADINKRLVAFFALMYFAALRPEEAANLRKCNLSLPEDGWGDLHLDSAAPEIGQEWTDSRARSEERGLKHREDGTGRTVPCSPELTVYLHDHLTRYGTARDGRLFAGERNGGRLSSTVYGRTWAKAREAVFTRDVAAGPLGKRPYDLRHAAVSTWLNAGVEPTRVADWAGHSVAVLLRVYAKCLDGGEQAARTKVQTAMGT